MRCFFKRNNLVILLLLLTLCPLSPLTELDLVETYWFMTSQSSPNLSLYLYIQEGGSCQLLYKDNRGTYPPYMRKEEWYLLPRGIDSVQQTLILQDTWREFIPLEIINSENLSTGTILQGLNGEFHLISKEVFDNELVYFEESSDQ